MRFYTGIITDSFVGLWPQYYLQRSIDIIFYF